MVAPPRLMPAPYERHSGSISTRSTSMAALAQLDGGGHAGKAAADDEDLVYWRCHVMSPPRLGGECKYVLAVWS
jgi:hypothetical protein